ncbi:MAG: signal peptide peptidase SppA [Deltaproteobacteria bacterium]|nr:signal peptide peptidase SppA [Deltaproteobacteria bacterium]
MPRSRSPLALRMGGQPSAPRRLGSVACAPLAIFGVAVGISMVPLRAAAQQRAAAQSGKVALDAATAIRPALPAYSLAGDDGAGAVFTNPANLGLDPDPSYHMQLRRGFGAQSDMGFAGAFNLGVLGTGVTWWSPAEGYGAWTLSESLGLNLGRGVAFGGRLNWVLPEAAGDRFLTGDLGLTWRPTPWFGAAVTEGNVGGAARLAGVPAVLGLGLTGRPLEDRLLVSLDVKIPHDLREVDPAVQAPTTVGAALRARVADGVVLRASADSVGAVGLGVELGYGGAGYGLFGSAPLGEDAAGPAMAAYLHAQRGDGDIRGQRPKIAGVTIDGDVPYRAPAGFFARDQETYLHLLERLGAAGRDSSVAGVLLDLESANLDLAQVEELRRVVASLRNKGKKVVVWLGGSPGNATYLLAAGADKVFMHPAGELELIGLSAELQYFRGALDLVGIEPTVAKRSTYKSAPEAFTNTEGSEGSREQMNALLNDLSGIWAEGIASGRGREATDVWALVDGGPYSAREAEGRGLVDGLMYPDELEAKLEEIFEGEPHLVADFALDSGVNGWRAQNEIAVIYVTGAITGGESAGPGFFGGGFSTGSETVVRQLEAAKEDDAVKAVVLRIDSPGGSAFASEEIWRAVERLKKEDKAVIVSMGSVAASGGYYVAANADAIYANSSTITGSIGVYFGPLLSLEGLYDKVGIHSELYTRGRHAGMYSNSKAPDPGEFAAIDRMVGETYAQFKKRVEVGRKLSVEQVEEVARGRVWSGAAAKRNGLVDELGGFEQAIARARAEAGIAERQSVSLVTYGDRLGPNREAMKRGVRSVVDLVGFAPAPRPSVPTFAELARLEDALRLRGDHVWAMMPADIEIK